MERLQTSALRKNASGRRSRASSRAREGLTLIEIMIVVVIVALASTTVSMGLGALTRTNLRSACVRFASVARYAYHRALTHGTTVRLSMDMANGNFTVTEAHGRITVVRSDAPIRAEAEQAPDDEEGSTSPSAAIDPWEAARLRIEQPDSLVFPTSPFQAITSESGKPIERLSGKPIGDDVRFAKVIVAHEAEPREEGIADLFFFPSGLTQHAVIQMVDRNDIIYSVEIHPLSGRTTFHDAPYEPEVLIDDPSERDESATELEDR